MAASTLGGKLELDDEGSFFVNGRNQKIGNPGSSVVTGVSPPGIIKVYQMYVHYRIPTAAKNLPVVMVHSQSGVMGLDVARQRPNLVKALVSVEGGCETVTPKDIATPFVKVPFVSVWGDNSKGAWGANGEKRRDGCQQAVHMINKGGGRASFTLLPAMGIAGNSHMMMMDKNNLRVADVILKWIADNSSK